MGAVAARAGDEDFAVGLNEHGPRLVAQSAHVGEDGAADAKAGIHAAIRVVSRDRKVIEVRAAAVVAHADGDDLAVRLQGHILRAAAL